MNWVPNKQLLLNVPFQSTNCRKKELSMDKKVRETIGDVSGKPNATSGTISVQLIFFSFL